MTLVGWIRAPTWAGSLGCQADQPTVDCAHLSRATVLAWECFSSPTSSQSAVTCCVRGKRYRFSDTDVPLKPGDIRADVKPSSVSVRIGEIRPALQLSCDMLGGEPGDNKS